MTRTKNIYFFISRLASFLAVMLLISCTDHTPFETVKTGDRFVWTTFNFGHFDFDRTAFVTRSTLGEIAESRVQDLYMFIFVGDKCVYSHHFDNTTKKASQAEFNAATEEECWYVVNRTSLTNTDQTYTEEDTHGSLRINAPTVTGGIIYLIANANAYTVNISPDKLNIVRTLADLKKLTATLNGDVVTRYGYFPMIATVGTEENGVTVNEQGITLNNSSVNAELIRLDAKVEVNLQAETGYSYTHNGKTQTVNSFTPESWRVVNVPKGSYIIDDAANDDGVTDYFNTSTLGFEGATEAETKEGKSTTKHSFSFYMLENRYTASQDVPDFVSRELHSQKDGDTDFTWAYAPEKSTYLEIKGYLSMTVSDPEGGNQELGANITYYIHLGDFRNGNYENFAIKRNTHYTYTILVKGVKNIEVEVETSNDGTGEVTENQPGATGDVFVSQQSIKLFDAHYNQYVYTLDASTLDPKQMNWYVRTPLTQLIGSPRLNGINSDIESVEYQDELKKYDYKWLWFMVNPVNGNTYSETNQWYPGDKNRTGGEAGKTVGDKNHLMDVEEFVNYIKRQKEIYDDPNSTEEHIFLDGKLTFTVYIDEFYYEKHPITGEVYQDLWKEFVGEQNRLVHILCGSNQSSDKESSVTNSVITIRQRSIQTPYNISAGSSVLTAWGTETEDETADDQLWFYNENDHYSNTVTNRRNNSVDNGRYNTALLLGMMSKTDDSSTPTLGSLRWETFIDYEQGGLDEQEHMTTYLKYGYKGMLYATLLRNRDNDGDGDIDADELRWYVGSLGQLYGIYIGEQGFTSMDAHLYSPHLASFKANEVIESGNFKEYRKWRNHVVSSTRHSTTEYRPTIIWAEEGISTSNYLAEQSWVQNNSDNAKLLAPLSIRCIRNLGMDYASEEKAKEKIILETEVPESLIKVRTEGSGSSTVYYFDLSNVNEASLRPTPSYTELEVTDEFNFMSRPYKGFVTGGLQQLDGTPPTDASGKRNYYLHLTTNYLNQGISPCTDGYRVPNVREGALMRLYCTNSSWWSGNTMITTYYSNGHTQTGGNGNDPAGAPDNDGTAAQKSSWLFGNNYATVEGSENRIREVQDWTPN